MTPPQKKKIANIILDYNPTSISNDQVKTYYESLKRTNNQKDPTTRASILPFPLPAAFTTDRNTEMQNLKTYNIHYISGLYSNPEIFQKKIDELKKSIQGKRPTAPAVVPILTAIDRYDELLKTITEKKYLYFPHIEFTAEGFFIIAPAEEKLSRKPVEGAPEKYNIVAYTTPTFTAKDNFEIPGETFTTPEKEAAYNNGQPEDKFYYKIKFHTCIGECGIIQLQYLLIRNIMTLDDPTKNTSGPKKGTGVPPRTEDGKPHMLDLSETNSILIVNSGKTREGVVVNTDIEVEDYLLDFEKNNSEGQNAGKAIVTLSNLIEQEQKNEKQKDVNFSIMFDNNYRRNVLEMLFFYSDARNSKIEDLKPTNIYMPGMVQQLFDDIDKHVKTNLSQLPHYSPGTLNFLSSPQEAQMGGSNKPKKISMFLDRLKRMYNRYVRRNNKKSKKRRPMKQNTRRKKKNGNKKSKKN